MTRFFYEELHVRALLAYHGLRCLALHLLDRPMWRYGVEVGALVVLVGTLLLMR